MNNNNNLSYTKNLLYYFSMFTSLSFGSLVLFFILVGVSYILPLALVLGLISFVLTHLFNISSFTLWYILPAILVGIHIAIGYFLSRINKKAQVAITIAHNALLDPLNIKGNERILDIGCGMGFLLLDATKRLTTGKAIGIDISEHILQMARVNVQRQGGIDRIELVAGDARALPFDNDSFDIIVSKLTLHCIVNQQERTQVLSEITRVLKPGGTVTIADIGSFSVYESFFKDHGFTAIMISDPYYSLGTQMQILKSTK